MFDFGEGDGAVDLSGLPVGELAGLIERDYAEERRREAQVLALAVAWVDAHQLDPALASAAERAVRWGGVGTPAVSEYCAHEFGALRAQSMGSARGLIADALDLRHRLPRLWSRVRAGGVRVWQARKVAQLTRHLDLDAVGLVDQSIAVFLGQLGWGRFLRVLDAAILDADPAGARERAERARTERDVWVADTDDGLKLLCARAAATDVTWLMATVNRIADILAERGDTDPVGARRSKALGWLTQPARALQLLIEYRGSVPQAEPATSAEPVAAPEPAEESDDHASLDLAPPARLTPEVVRAAAPQVVLHFHISDVTVRTGRGLVRPEHGGPLELEQLRTFLAETGCVVRVQPVIDPAEVAPVDGYEIPTRLRAAVRYRQVADIFPYATLLTRSMDVDHTIPYRSPDRGGPPGQTGLANLGPMSRTNHRAKTHGRWREGQPDPGTYLFRSPTGRVFVVTNQGTLPLGRTDYADAVWRAGGRASLGRRPTTVGPADSS